MAKNNGKTGETEDKNGIATSTGSASDAPAAAGQPPQLDPEIAAKLAAVRGQVREAFGKVAMALMMVPRYRSQTLADLQHLVLEPLIRDRLAIAYPDQAAGNPLADMAGFAFWASVSEEVDAKIREQIAAGTFPVRLKPEDWDSGSINWLLDVVAPDTRATTSVIANFRQIVKEGSLRLHPLINRLVDPETLRKMGAQKLDAAEPAPAE